MPSIDSSEPVILYPPLTLIGHVRFVSNGSLIEGLRNVSECLTKRVCEAYEVNYEFGRVRHGFKLEVSPLRGVTSKWCADYDINYLSEAYKLIQKLVNNPNPSIRSSISIGGEGDEFVYLHLMNNYFNPEQINCLIGTVQRAAIIIASENKSLNDLIKIETSSKNDKLVIKARALDKNLLSKKGESYSHV